MLWVVGNTIELGAGVKQYSLVDRRVESRCLLITLLLSIQYLKHGGIVRLSLV